MGEFHMERIIRAALRRAGRDSSPAAVAAVIADIERRDALRRAQYSDSQKQRGADNDEQ